MDKQLDEHTKEELISIIQDYQEMVSDIENELNKSFAASKKGIEVYTPLRLKIRDILDEYL